MIKYNLQQLKDRFKELKYEWLPFMLIGIRSKADAPDKFDDTLILIEGESIAQYPCTTNPGIYWLQKFANPKGAAVLKPAQYKNSWHLGLHRGKYQALTQMRPVTVWRDSDKDNKSEKGIEDTGMFGINIHRSSPSLISTIIGSWSAGCQVFQNPADFNYVIDRCRKSGQGMFTYTLLDEF